MAKEAQHEARTDRPVAVVAKLDSTAVSGTTPYGRCRRSACGRQLDGTVRAFAVGSGNR
jgi:hypothetical protein